MTSPISKPISYDFNDKPVYAKTLEPENPTQQIVIMELFESSINTSGEIPKYRRSSATDLIALPKGINSDEDIEGKPPVSER